ncbi:MAG: phosphate/phosphite/phosphonate ABC transporter substrate-binding protein [Negativicutes bacterium]|nr:phosphate/phosphite/phosphonate ABC transporter substrate-binding protein [Negativicutes bacterium]
MFRKTFLLLVFIIAVILFSGCSTEPAKVVSLNKTNPEIITKDKVSDQKPLRIAVSSIVSPKETLTVYQPLVDYVEEKLGYPVVLLQRKTYKEVNDLLQNGGAEVAFVCSGGYVAGNQSFGMELLAVPEVKGERLYQSYIIARESQNHSIMDLKGRTFAFTDPMSFSGRIAPVYMLLQQGIDSDRFFSRTFFTYSHDNAIQAVADGIADAAAVDSMIFDRAVEQNPDLGKRVFIIDKSLRVGSPPVVVKPTTDAATKQQLRALLLQMNTNENGRKALSALNYDKFVVPSDEDYAELKNVWHLVKEKL